MGYCYYLNISRKQTAISWHCLLEVYHNTSGISVLAFYYLIQFGLVYQLKKKKNPKLFLGQERERFFCQSKQWSFVFATFNTSWLSYSRLLMTPKNFSGVPVLLDSPPCCCSPSSLGHRLHSAVGNTLTTGSSAGRLTGHCRTEGTGSLRCYSCSEGAS